MTSDNYSNGKISGYLEKRGKIRIGSPWRKYWFVLEGRLLLYYRSKDEYDTIRPCKGSVSLCPPCNVKLTQNASCTFQIECRYNTVTLRAENRSEQERWMQAIMLATSQTKITSNRMYHFRYSLDDLSTQTKQNKENTTLLTRQNTLPNRFKSPKRERKQLLDKLQTTKYQHSSHSVGALNNPLREKYIKSPRLPKNKNLSRLLKQSNSIHNVGNSVEEGNEISLNKSQSYEEIITNNTKSTRKSKYWKSEGHLVSAKGSFCSLTQTPIEEEGENISLPVSNDYPPCPMNKSVDKDVALGRNDSLKCAYNSLTAAETQYQNLKETLQHQQLEREPISTEDKSDVETEKISSQSSSNDKKTKQKGCRIKTLLWLVKSPKESEASPKKINRNPSFVKKMWKRKFKGLEKEKEEPTMEDSNRRKEVVKSISDNPMALQLQKIMESRRQSIRKSFIETEPKTEVKEEGTQHLETDFVATTISTDEKPSLPPRQYRRPSSPYHDTPRTSKPIIEKRYSTPLPQSPGNYKTIEEILVELGEQKQIDHETSDKANTIVGETQEVVLRKKLQSPEEMKDESHQQHHQHPHQFQLNKVNGQEVLDSGGRYSSDLGALLEELTKITSAPVLSPGNTCSLITPVTVPEDWLQISPNRRRMSDPDYDIPRPHKSLQFNIDSKSLTDNRIPATQFFGPILQSSPPNTDNSISPIQKAASSWNSIDPDSLETSRPNYFFEDPIPSKLKEDWERNISYTSHDYNKSFYRINEDVKDKTIMSYNLNVSRESFVYTDNNESDIKVNEEKEEYFYNFKEELKRVDTENVKESLARRQEQFIDSLEPYTEVSTTF